MIVRVGVGVAGLAAALAVGGPAAAGGGHGGGKKGGHGRPGQAAVVVQMSGHSVPARASRSCPRWFDTVDLRGRDRWTFSHSGGSAVATVTAFFDVNGDGRADRKVRVAAGGADDGRIVRDRRGGGVAWLVTRSGWRLVHAEAVVGGGGAGRLVLAEACAGPRVQKHAPSKRPHKSSQQRKESRQAPKRVQQPVQGETKVPVVVVVQEKPKLPVTGPGFGGLMGGGAGLIGAGGIAVLAARWRRRPAAAELAGDEVAVTPAGGGATSDQS
ncbi:MAG TPA: hypothetical protein VFY17_08545 [Pilimelia sp.]|nr:hypothetical protein [Pilimelia sp.]